MFSLTEVGAPDLPFFIGDFMAAFMVALFDDKKQSCANVMHSGVYFAQVVTKELILYIYTGLPVCY